MKNKHIDIGHIIKEWFGGLFTSVNHDKIYLIDNTIWTNPFVIMSVEDNDSVIHVRMNNAMLHSPLPHLSINLIFDLTNGRVVAAYGSMCMSMDLNLSDKECVFFYDNNIDITYYTTIGIKRYNRQEIMRRWSIQNIVKHA